LFISDERRDRNQTEFNQIETLIDDDAFLKPLMPV